MADYALIAVSLLLTTAGQLWQKAAAQRATLDPAQQLFLFKLLRYRQTWFAVVCLAAGMLCWLLVLYLLPVSKAVPFLSLGVVLVVLAARLRLRENISLQRWAGVCLITLGLLLVASS